MAAIHPNSRQTKPVPGKYIVMLTLGDMKNLTFAYPVLRRTADGCIEVRLLRLIGTNILRRHREQECGRCAIAYAKEAWRPG
jgi:hypothetical protein